MKALFLLKTYNDIDHITPVIYKFLQSGEQAFIAFTKPYNHKDFRLDYLIEHGAIITSFYTHMKLQSSNFILIRIIRKLYYYLYGYSYFQRWLAGHNINVVINEWSGGNGDGMSHAFLVSARKSNIPTVSLPHGMNIFLNEDPSLQIHHNKINKNILPDFSDRNYYSMYVVQSEFHRDINIKFGVDPNKIRAIGSARFCPEWMKIYDQLVKDSNILSSHSLTVLFFLPHWSYRVHRKPVIEMLCSVASQKSLTLIIKGHTRGSGSLSREEYAMLSGFGNIYFAGEDDHSSSLLNKTDVLISFGTSMALEAVIKKINIINPSYLHENTTIFDETESVNTVRSLPELLELLKKFVDDYPSIPSSIIDPIIINKLVFGGHKQHDVLKTYISSLYDAVFETN